MSSLCTAQFLGFLPLFNSGRTVSQFEKDVAVMLDEYGLFFATSGASPFLWALPSAYLPCL
ncbi:MAG: hypothetical protein IPP33_10585 [Flavobacteriales bacterium]|nr:hypothetical protein [Flavobacteriales bacterium]